jgi:hypothetical protein
MARLVSLSDLRSDIATRYDLPATYSSTGWASTTAVNRLINESIQRFRSILAEAYGDNYLLASTTITTTADIPVSSLPADFYKLTKLSWRKDTKTAVPVLRGDVNDLARSTLASQAWARPKYLLTAGTITWLPVPNQAYTVDCWYQSILGDLSADGDTVDCGPGWAEWIVLDVCRKLASREQKDPSVWLMELSQAEAFVRSQAPDRAETDAPCVRDVMGYSRLGTQERRDLITWGDE